MIEKLRSTTVYKFCGFCNYIYIAFLLLFYLFLNIVPGAYQGIFFAYIPIICLVLPMLIIVMFVTLFITYFITKNKDIILKFSIAADIGNILNVIILLICFKPFIEIVKTLLYWNGILD